MPHLATARRPSNKKTRPVKVNLLGTEAIVHVPNTLTQLVQHTGGLQRGIAGFHGIFITGCLSSISRNKQGCKPVPGEFDVQHMEHRPAYRASLALDITLYGCSPMSATVKSLADVMSFRLAMIDAGTISPSKLVVEATRKLVQELGELDSNEEIEVSISQRDPLKAQYIRTKTGVVLAEIDATQDI
jgi:hypothetical protein